jgi:hypothetical protein
MVHRWLVDDKTGGITILQSEEYPARRRAASLTCCSQVKKLIAIVSPLLGNMG